jgi:hypothetical protein
MRVMSPISLHHVINVSAHALPAALMYSRQLLAEKGSALMPVESPEDKEENLINRATRMTELLKHIQGYDHGGLNE